MARVNQLVCDRCKRTIGDVDRQKDLNTAAHNRLLRYDTDYHGTRVDLCDDCRAQFKHWMENPSGAPLGWEFKPRPCPHHIPCADPRGCSGQELVRIKT